MLLGEYCHTHSASSHPHTEVKGIVRSKPGELEKVCTVSHDKDYA